MINYFKELFTKPKYQWTALDNLAMGGLILCGLIILAVICFAIYIIYLTICDKKYSKCNNMKLGGSGSYDCQKKKCLFCKDFKCKMINKKKTD